jgi:hypothetical protein
MVVIYQNFGDPFVVILALPATFCGILVMLYATGTTLNVPSLMGAITAAALRHRRPCRRRSELLAMVNPQISHRGSHRLQVGHVDVEIHPIDRLVLKHHMITQYVLRLSTDPRTQSTEIDR